MAAVVAVLGSRESGVAAFGAADEALPAFGTEVGPFLLLGAALQTSKQRDGAD